MSLRNFQAYDKSAAQSLLTNAGTLAQIDGNYFGVGGEYFQIFDKATAAVANDVPIMSFLIPGAGPVNLVSVFETMAPITLLLGLSVGISTVNEKYTASASAFDVWGATEEVGIPITGLTATTQNNVDTHTSLANPATQRLYRLIITGMAATPRWLMLFGAAPVNGDRPLQSIPLYTGDATAGYTIQQQDLNFGSQGLVMNTKIGATVYQGVYWVISTTGDVLTLSVDGVADWVSYVK